VSETSREEIFRVRLFRERGYLRQQCSSCRAYFWSPVRRDNCGDTPCTDYYFDRISIKSPPLTVKEVRDRFLKFFQDRGHEVIDPYPVVARWREDLFLTIASIAVFQPHVTKMIVPPPANPLVIAQPCIRLEDLGNIGYTLGRHLTNFIMGGHHAFNYPDKFVYFTDKTVEYAVEFFTEVMGVPEEELSLKESWWEGGGNAGPCFEVSVGGLEVATLVFMMYDVVEDGYREMPLKIVDTGYGIERIAWLTQKTPTAFHAIYGDLVHEYHKLLGVREPPDKLLYSLLRKSGRLDPRVSENFRRAKALVSEELGLPIEEVDAYVSGAVQVYNVLDHLKTAILMLSDGVVPSNSGEGYLARLVLRKTFRILTKLGVGLDVLHKLLDLQIRYWRDLYPSVPRAEQYIHEVVEVEFLKYSELVGRAPSVIRRYLTKGSTGLSLEEFVELYESHGIPPEEAAEIASRLGYSVEAPREFYSVLASRRSRAPIKKTEAVPVPEDIAKAILSLPETRRLFHEDPYMREFRAKVLGAFGNYVVLDQTAFYPEGGGQKPDTGTLEVDDLVLRVVDVRKVGGVILHKVDREVPKEYVGREVVGRIDWNRRYAHMRHHTATHILLGVLRKLYGDHVWQAGAEKEVTKGRLDVTHYKLPTPEEVERMEREVNRVINEAWSVDSKLLYKYDAERLYGFRLYQGGVPLEPYIRVVEVGGLDAEACYGTHLRNTAEVGGFKIINVEKIQDGVIRFEYVAGPQLVEYVASLESKLREASKLVGGEVSERLPKLLKELDELRRRLQNYRDLAGKSLRRLFEAEARRVSEGCLLSVVRVEFLDEELFREVLKDYVSKVPEAVVILIAPVQQRSLIEVSEGSTASRYISAVDLVRELSSLVGGRGGGKRDHAVLTITKQLSDPEVLNLTSYLEKRVRELCTSL